MGYCSFVLMPYWRPMNRDMNSVRGARLKKKKTHTKNTNVGRASALSKRCLSIHLIKRNYFYYKLEIKFHFFSSPFVALPNMDLIFFSPTITQTAQPIS